MLSYIIFLFNKQAFSLHLGGGVSFVEEGDDRSKGGVNLNLELEKFTSSFHLISSTYGPIKQNMYLISMGRRFSLPSSFDLEGQMGASVVDYNTTINYKKEVDQSFNTNENAFHVGFQLGLVMTLMKSGPLLIRAMWQSHLFPAGTGVIALSTGRISTISIVIGGKV